MTDRRESPASPDPDEGGGTAEDQTTEAVFNSISAQALETNRVRVADLGRLTGGLATRELSAADRRQAKDLAHQIAGSAGTFGFVRASELAREIEDVLVDSDPSAAALRERVAELRAALG